MDAQMDQDRFMIGFRQAGELQKLFSGDAGNHFQTKMQAKASGFEEKLRQPDHFLNFPVRCRSVRVGQANSVP